MTLAKLSVDSAGKVHGSGVTWNSPWPCENGDSGEMSVPHGIMGVVMHTMDGNLPGTISWFNNSAAEASAHFGVDQSGNVHQFGPITGWKAWAEADGNPNWYSIEFADNAAPATPLTQAQINAGGQLVEVLSRVGNFPLQLSESPSVEGFGWHGMGGVSWGNHPDCPGNVRKAQRAAVLAVAKAVRNGTPAPAVNVLVWTSAGQLSLNDLCSQHLHNAVSTVIRLTAEHSPGAVFTSAAAAYINTVFAADTVKVPAGIRLYLGNQWFTTTGHQTLLGIADSRKLHPAGVLQSTAEKSTGAVFAGNIASYVDGVFARSTVKVPSGTHIYYES